MDDVEYSTAFCDAYIQKCINTGKSQIAELSVLDLSQTNNVIDALNELSGKLVSIQKTSTATKELSGAAKYSAIYGMKSIANLFDINNFLSAATYFDEEIDIDPVQDTCDAFVIHSVKGQQTENLGVSMYYPLTYNKKEIDTYVKNCPIENYGELLNSIYGHYPVLTVRLAHAGRISDDGRFEVTLTPDSLNYTTKNSRLPNGRYRYQFMFTDIFGNSFASDYALLKIESNDVRLIEVQHT